MNTHGSPPRKRKPPDETGGERNAVGSFDRQTRQEDKTNTREAQGITACDGPQSDNRIRVLIVKPDRIVEFARRRTLHQAELDVRRLSYWGIRVRVESSLEHGVRR